MQLRLGPVLGFRGATDATWRVSALVVRAAGEPPPQPALASPRAAIVATTRLHAAPSGEVAWRVDVDVARPPAGELTIAYTLDGATHAFCVPARGQPLKLAVASCNGFSDVKDKREYGPNANERWQSLLAKHAAAPRHLLLLLGDQVYADSVWRDCDLRWLKRWLDAGEAQREKFKLPPAHADQLAQFYFALYCERWSQAEVRQALASIPTLMMWDDHDIFDGWGSHDAKLQGSNVFAAIFAAAERAFRVFQLQVPPGGLPPGSIAGGALSWAQRIDRLGILALDLRSERTPSQVMHEASWQPVLAAVDALANDPAAIEHLFVISGPPVMYPATGLVEDIVDAIPGDQGFEDDLRDRWGSEPHVGARERLVLRLLAAAERRRVRVTILSGDVHMAALGVIKSSRSRAPTHANVINNLIASPIVHKPPSKLAVLALKVLDERFDLARDVEGAMHDLPESTRRYLPRRNYLLLDAVGSDYLATWWVAYAKRPGGERSFRKTLHRVQ